MREIKFRAWDKLGDDEGNPCMRSWDQLLRDKYANSADSIFNDKMLILMQYTGIKDKKGVEIYEGDIVRCVSDHVGTVVWKEEDACFNVDGYYCQSDDYPTMAFMEGQPFEVIGNVCENPELVKEST